MIFFAKWLRCGQLRRHGTARHGTALALALIGYVSPIVPPYLALMLVGTSLVTLALFNEWRCRR